MTVLALVASAVLAIVGAMLMYLVSPQQQWRVRGPWPERGGVWPGSLCTLLSLALLWPHLGAAAAVSTWLTLLMLVWTVAPFLGAWRARARTRRAA